MSHTRLTLGDAARERILAGATALADAVRVTLGPKSKSIVVERKWGAPLVCNDGVTIAKAVDLEDPEANVGVRLMREAAEKTDDSVGAARQVLGPADAWVRPSANEPSRPLRTTLPSCGRWVSRVAAWTGYRVPMKTTPRG